MREGGDRTEEIIGGCEARLAFLGGAFHPDRFSPVRQPSPSFLAILFFLAGGLYLGRVVFPKVDPEREIARRLADRERKSAEAPVSGFGTAVTGASMEKWTEVVKGWKFMDPVVAPKEGLTAAAMDLNLGEMKKAFQKAEGAARLTQAVAMGQAWGQVDPAGAIAWADKLPDAAERSAAHQGVAQGWAKEEPIPASEWLAAMEEGPERNAIVSAYVKAAAPSCPRLALAFALSEADPAERAKLVGQALKSASVLIPEEAEDMLASARISPREKEDFRESLSNLRQGVGGEP